MSKSAIYKKLIQSETWRRIRLAKLEHNPACEQCAAKGRTTAATCVHHITPVESATSEQEAAALCYSMSNLQSLCYECHSAIHCAKRYNGRAAHKERTADCVARWKNKHGIDTRGGLFFAPPGGVPKSTDLTSGGEEGKRFPDFSGRTAYGTPGNGHGTKNVFYHIEQKKPCEMEACEMEACETETCEMETCETETCETEACEMEACEMEACEMEAGRGVREELIPGGTLLPRKGGGK